jgi:hypothetical protein
MTKIVFCASAFQNMIFHPATEVKVEVLGDIVLGVSPVIASIGVRSSVIGQERYHAYLMP